MSKWTEKTLSNEVQMSNKYMKKCSTFFAIREMQIYIEIPSQLSQSGYYQEKRMWIRGREEKDLIFTAGGNAN
jgi:hypothetical protein